MSACERVWNRGLHAKGPTVFRGGDRYALRRPHAVALVVAVAVVCACGIYAVPAFAFVSRSTKTIVIPKDSPAAVTTKCPAGEHVSFSGVMSEFRGPITASNARIVFTTGMHRLGTNPAALTETAVNPRSVGAHYTATAYCDRGTVPTVAAKTVPLGSFGLAVALVNCPAGTVGVGGGFASGSGPRNIEYLGELGMNTATQLVVGVANLSNVATKLTALVYCAAGTAPTEVRKQVSVAGQKLVSAEVTCPTGTKLVWGGLDSSPPSGTPPNVSGVIPLSWYAPSINQWKVTADNLGNKAGTVTAVAYCR
jgi:hypothetical protein